MTSPSDRITLRLSHDQAELLRALAYEFHNTPSSLAAIYVRKGMEEALARGGRLAGIPPGEFRADALEGLRLARELGLALPEPRPSPEPLEN